MPITLYRVDERLLHGQVVVGWGGRLELDYYVVVDDPLAESEWEQELYAAGLPDGVEVRFLSVAAAVSGLEDLERASPGAGAVLTRDTAAMRALAEAGLLEGRRVDVGGLHAGPDRRRALDYVHLSAAAAADLAAIGDRAGEVVARDLPGSPAVSLETLLEAVRRPGEA